MNSGPPNILWICTDQQRYDTIHTLGNPIIHTPNLDHLCVEGVAFTHTYCKILFVFSRVPVSLPVLQLSTATSTAMHDATCLKMSSLSLPARVMSAMIAALLANFT